MSRSSEPRLGRAELTELNTIFESMLLFLTSLCKIIIQHIKFVLHNVVLQWALDKKLDMYS